MSDVRLLSGMRVGGFSAPVRTATVIKGETIEIPAEFWDELSPPLSGSHLSMTNTRQLWRALGIKGKPRKPALILINRADLEMMLSVRLAAEREVV